eukprot:3996991-Prymnesium_polylepis.1
MLGTRAHKKPAPLRIDHHDGRIGAPTFALSRSRARAGGERGGGAPAAVSAARSSLVDISSHGVVTASFATAKRP